jgi:hypothetical protein
MHFSQPPAGFLPKDMFHEHRRRSELMKATQEAVKVLDMAGLELESDTALALLRQAKVPEEVVAKVVALGAKHRREREAAVAVVGGREREGEGEGVTVGAETGARAGAPGSGGVGGVGGDVTTVGGDGKASADASEPVPFVHLSRYKPDMELPDTLVPMSPAALEAYQNRYVQFNQPAKKKFVNTTKKYLRRMEERAKAEAAAAAAASESPVACADVAAASAVNGPIPSSSSIAKSASLQHILQAGSSVDPTALSQSQSQPQHRLSEKEDAHCICQRCFRLQQYGQVQESLRPGWSENELLTPERFESLLSTIKNTPSVVLCLVDVFDLKGSILPNLKQIAGKNPVVIAVNKVDLLPRDVSLPRLHSWIHSELMEACGYLSPRDEQVRDLYYDDVSTTAGAGEAADATGAHKDRKYRRPDGVKFNYFRAPGVPIKMSKEDKEGQLLRSANIHLVSCHSGK